MNVKVRLFRYSKFFGARGNCSEAGIEQTDIVRIGERSCTTGAGLVSKSPGACDGRYKLKKHLIISLFLFGKKPSMACGYK